MRRNRGGDAFDRSMTVLLDEQEANTAATKRTRWALGSLIDEEAATFLGTLLDLAERGAHVHIHRGATAPLRGSLRVVGEDVVGVARVGQPMAWIALDTIDAVTPAQSRVAARGDRETSQVTMQAILFDRAGTRPRVAIRKKSDAVAVTGTRLTGTLSSCGVDVCSVRAEAGELFGSGSTVVHLRIAAIAEVVFLDD